MCNLPGEQRVGEALGVVIYSFSCSFCHCCFLIVAGGKTMADLTYAIKLDEDEITFLIQLLNERLVALEREHPSSPDTPVRPPKR
jgi:hypothetical protein